MTGAATAAVDAIVPIWESCIVQAIATRSKADAARADSLPALAGRFEEHWGELLRFISKRRAYSGPAGNLSSVQLGALRALADRDLRMSDLAASLGLAESTTTRLVDRLEAAGLVQRGTHADRRCVVATLTGSGQKVIEQVRQERRAFLTEILEPLPRKERAELVRLFGRVAQELRAREVSRS